MKRALPLFIFVLISLWAEGNAAAQDPPFARILTADSAWCQQANNRTTAEILITGDVDTSRFDLVVDLRGTRDTLVNLSSGVFTLFLNNQTGRNEYALIKIIEHQEYSELENDLSDVLVMEVHTYPDMTFTAEYDDLCSPSSVVFRAEEGYPEYTWDFDDGEVKLSLIHI